MTSDDTPIHATDPRDTGARPGGGARYESRRIPPSGPVSPDGTRPWPNLRHGTGPLVFGGIVLGAAAVTVASLLAVRFITNRAAGDDGEGTASRAAAPMPPPAAHDSEHGHWRKRGWKPHDAEAPRHPHAGRPRAEFVRPRLRPFGRRGRRSGSVNEALSGMSAGVGSLLSNITAAMEGFRGVAGEAGSIADEFRIVADKLRDLLKVGAAQSVAEQTREDDKAPETRGEDGRHHRL